MGAMPHCDSAVLHAPGTCEYCDEFPEWQRARQAWGIAFTSYPPKNGQLPCPSEVRRDIDVINKWPGNRHSPTVASTTMPTTPPTTSPTVQPTAPPSRVPIGVVNAVCPDCNEEIPVFVAAEPAGRSDDGIWQVVVISDKFDIESHSFTCRGQSLV